MPRAQLAMAFAESTVDWATEELELTLEEVGQALGVNRRTIGRWREGVSEPSPEHRKNLERISQLRHFLRTSFRDPDAAQSWMQTPLDALQGRTPHFAMCEGDLERVVRLLGTLASGAHI